MSSHPFDILDTAPYVCILSSNPELAYGPMEPAEAMAFTDKWNTFFAERGIPGTWSAIPLVTPNKSTTTN